MDGPTILAVQVCEAEHVGGTALGVGVEAAGAEGASGELHVGLRCGEDAGDEEGDDSEGLHFERGGWKLAGSDCEKRMCLEECDLWVVGSVSCFVMSRHFWR